MFPTNSERLMGISDAFFAFFYGYLSSCPRAHCTPYKSVPTLRYTRRHGPIYIYTHTHTHTHTQLHARRHLPSAVPCISEDRLLPLIIACNIIILSLFCHLNQACLPHSVVCCCYQHLSALSECNTCASFFRSR